MLEKVMGKSWSNAIEPYLDKQYFGKLGEFLAKEYEDNVVFPSIDDIFNAFKLTNYDNLKVVILGLDPYIRENQAYGISFGVRDSCLTIPPSLRNIATEIENDIYNGLNLGFDYTLQSWCDQGCFMYNTALTVIKGKTGSHLKAWTPFTEAVLKSLNCKDFLIYVLLGKVAQSYEKFIDTSKMHIIKAPHPSAESYAGGKAGFFGSGVFSKVNEILIKNNKEIIKW